MSRFLFGIEIGSASRTQHIVRLVFPALVDVSVPRTREAEDLPALAGLLGVLMAAVKSTAFCHDCTPFFIVLPPVYRWLTVSRWTSSGYLIACGLSDFRPDSTRNLFYGSLIPYGFPGSQGLFIKIFYMEIIGLDIRKSILYDTRYGDQRRKARTGNGGDRIGKMRPCKSNGAALSGP